MNESKKRQIISDICLESGLDPTTVKIVYMAIVRYVMKRLRFKGICPLPDFGDFRVVAYVPRKSLNVNSGVMEDREGRKVIKFAADKKIRYYLNDKIT